ncbi:MAG: hypothetical protein ABIT01_12265, partial [Thermoanaerobaculia bacterium]
MLEAVRDEIAGPNDGELEVIERVISLIRHGCDRQRTCTVIAGHSALARAIPPGYRRRTGRQVALRILSRMEATRLPRVYGPWIMSAPSNRSIPVSHRPSAASLGNGLWLQEFEFGMEICTLEFLADLRKGHGRFRTAVRIGTTVKSQQLLVDDVLCDVHISADAAVFDRPTLAPLLLGVAQALCVSAWC